MVARSGGDQLEAVGERSARRETAGKGALPTTAVIPFSASSDFALYYTPDPCVPRATSLGASVSTLFSWQSNRATDTHDLKPATALCRPSPLPPLIPRNPPRARTQSNMNRRQQDLHPLTTPLR